MDGVIAVVHVLMVSAIILAAPVIALASAGWMILQCVREAVSCEPSQQVAEFMRRNLADQWRLGMFVALCCMSAGVVYGFVMTR